MKIGQKEAPEPSDFSVTTITTIYLNENEYAALSALPAHALRKRRYHVEDGGSDYAIDVFEGAHEGLILAEVSFATGAQMAAHPVPEFAVREVTSEVQFTGGALAADNASDGGSGGSG
jgi:CYTH domain-containing protein